MTSVGAASVAGPLTTAPLPIAYRLLWHGHTMLRSSTCDTVQPWWVQMAENTRNRPSRGWVTTTRRSRTTTPPPTGTSRVRMTAGAPPASAESTTRRGPVTPTEAALISPRREMQSMPPS